MTKYELIIVGCGIAGATAAIYASRLKVNFLVLTRDLGGQINLTDCIDNYPTIKNISGSEFVKRLYEHLLYLKVPIVFEKVDKIEDNSGFYCIRTNSSTYKAKTVIIATGKAPKKLNVTGEQKFEGRGVSYCAVCDAPLYKDKIVAVVGGGNSALEAALLLSKYARKVYLIHRRDSFRGFLSLVEKVSKVGNIEIVYNHVIKEIKGSKHVEKIIIEEVRMKNNNAEFTGNLSEIPVDGVFIKIGYIIDHKPFKDFVKLDEHNQIVIDNLCRTYKPNGNETKPGVFAAGDVTNTPFKQLVIAAGEGAKAALQAYEYLKGKKTLAWH